MWRSGGERGYVGISVPCRSKSAVYHRARNVVRRPAAGQERHAPTSTNTTAPVTRTALLHFLVVALARPRHANRRWTSNNRQLSARHIAPLRLQPRRV